MAKRSDLIGYGSPEKDLEAAQVAMHLLCAYFPASARDLVRNELADVLEHQFEASGKAVPVWLEQVRAHPWVPHGVG